MIRTSFFILWTLLSLLSATAQNLQNEETIQTQKAKRLEQRAKTISNEYQRDFNTEKPAGSIAVNRDERYMNMTPEELVREVFLKSNVCSSVENIEVKIMNWDSSKKEWVKGKKYEKGLAYFDKADSDFPMQNGLVMSTGDVREVEGPNRTSGALSTHYSSLSYYGDQDLQSILDQYSGPLEEGEEIKEVTDVAVIEFDFIPSNTKIEFQYIFSSEEYPLYVFSQFNDIFGFFINEIGQTEKTNIALLPTTDSQHYEVYINNVNNGYYIQNDMIPNSPDAVNRQYFVPNVRGNLTSEMNGYTVVLTAKYDNIKPCTKYHLKLALANVGDDVYGSAVFLAANSFDTGENMTIYGNGIEGMKDIYIGCDNNKIRIHRPSDSLEQTIQQSLEYEGTAKNGIDIVGLDGLPLPTTITLLPNMDYIDIPFRATSTAQPDSYLSVILKCFCAEITELNTEKIYLRKRSAIKSMQATSSCINENNGTILVSEEGLNNVEYSINGGATWQSSNLFTDLAVGSYVMKIRSKGACFSDEKNFEILELKADAGHDMSQTDQTFVMEGNEPNYKETGLWTLVNEVEGVEIKNPELYNTTIILPTDATATLRWTVSNDFCSVSDEVTLTHSNSNIDELTIELFINEKIHELNTRYIVPKDYNKDYLDLKVVTSNPTAIVENLPATANVSIPSLNKITFSTIFNNEKDTYSFEIEKRYQFSELIVMRWDNVLTVINRPEVLHHEVIAYQWYKNGQPITGATRQSYSASKEGLGLLNTDNYYVEVRVKDSNTGEEKTLRCWEEKVTLKNNKIIAYPNPVSPNEIITVKADLENITLKEGTIYIYNSIGNLISTQSISGDINQIVAPSALGFYVLRLVANDGIKEDFKLIVK